MIQGAYPYDRGTRHGVNGCSIKEKVVREMEQNFIWGEIPQWVEYQ